MKYFIHTNSKQYLPAQVSRFNALKNRGVEEVTILKVEDYLDLEKLNGKSYLRNGRKIKWFKDDLQSFTLLRFLIPEICKFEGYALLTDPDVFLLKDYPLVERHQN